MLSDQFQKIVFIMTGLITMSAPALAQGLAPQPQCARYEQELRAVDNQILVSQRQSPRTMRLMQMLHQAKQDGDKFSCYPTRFRSASGSEQCRYILGAQQRISAALGKTTHQTATGPQRKWRHTLYQEMLKSGCRTPQELHQLMRDNRPAKAVKQRQRLNPNYRAQQPHRQAALPKTAEPVTFISQQDAGNLQAVKKTDTVGYSIPAVPALQHTKAAEPSPPPREPVTLDYVSDPNIRRVGPLFLPAQ